MSHTPIEPDDTGWEQSEELDQVQPEDSLDPTATDDILDEGIVPNDGYRGEGFGTTAAEVAEGETLDQRIAQEIPDPDPYEQAERDAQADNIGSGDAPAGRLVEPNQGSGEDIDKDLIGTDVGVDGGAQSAEEDAVHLLDESE